MIRLVFTANRELMHFFIVDKNIYYSDKKWAMWIRCLPRPDNFIQKVSMSRNRFPAYLINLFKFTEEEQKEYDKATGENEIADIVTRDANSRGCKLVVRKETTLDAELKKKILESEIVTNRG